MLFESKEAMEENVKRETIETLESFMTDDEIHEYNADDSNPVLLRTSMQREIMETLSKNTGMEIPPLERIV